jgi:hypothetical protein
MRAIGLSSENAENRCSVKLRLICTQTIGQENTRPTNTLFFLIVPAQRGYPELVMKPPGSYKLTHRARAPEPNYFDPFGLSFGRCERIVESLRHQILAGGPDQCLRIRQVFATPREIFRIEIQEPELSYHRTTLLDRDALEELLETEEVRERVVYSHES